MCRRPRLAAADGALVLLGEGAAQDLEVLREVLRLALPEVVELVPVRDPRLEVALRGEELIDRWAGGLLSPPYTTLAR
eukprot:4537812-Prymnesium_polylepis.1